MPNLGDLFQSFLVILVQNSIEIVVSLVFALVVFPLRSRIVAFVQAHVDAAQLARIKAIVDTVVLAAEQSGLKDGLLQTGAERRAWAINRIQELLRERGLGIIANNVELISTLLEASVYEQLNSTPTLAFAEGLGEIEFNCDQCQPATSVSQ